MPQPLIYNLWKAITPSNSVDFPDGPSMAVYVGGAGDVAAVMQNNQVQTFVGVLVGTTLPIAARRINATGTSATNLVWMREV